MYNKKVITQLGTCKVIIDYKDNKKKGELYVVPRNGQVQLACHIQQNIDSMEAASMQKKTATQT